MGTGLLCKTDFLQAAELNEGMQGLIKEIGLTTALVSMGQQAYQPINFCIDKKQPLQKMDVCHVQKSRTESRRIELKGNN